MLSLVLCTYKRPALLQTSISNAIKVLDKIEESELIVVNDDGSNHLKVQEHPKIRLVNNPKHGLASARNLGAKLAKGDLILFIDDDIEFTLDNIERLLIRFKKRPPACYNPNWKYSDELMSIVEQTSFGRFLIKNNLTNYKGWVPELNWSSSLFEVNKLAGFFMLIPKDIFMSSGGFDEEFINQGTEDDELCIRLKNMGVKFYVDAENYVFHNEIDRISLESRLSRYINGSINRRKAFELGYKEYEIKYSLFKKIISSVLLPFRGSLISICKLIPNKPSFDVLYFKLANILIALSIYKGYSTK